MIKVNNKYLYKGRTVVVIQLSEKRQRVEITDNLINKTNPFWVDFEELVESVESLDELVERHELINTLFEQGKEIPEELTKNFITFPLDEDGQDIR